MTNSIVTIYIILKYTEHQYIILYINYFPHINYFPQVSGDGRTNTNKKLSRLPQWIYLKITEALRSADEQPTSYRPTDYQNILQGSSIPE